jgi:hypothetical protein
VRVGEVEAGPGHADEVRQVEQLLVVRQLTIWASASAPVMKNSSASGAARAGR